MVRRKRFGLTAVSVSAAAALVFALVPPAKAEPGHDVTPEQQRALDAGIQIAPKGGATAKAARTPRIRIWPTCPTSRGPTTAGGSSGWPNRAGSEPSRLRSPRTGPGPPGGRPRLAFVHDEEEPTGTSGSNDSQANAEPMTGFGTGRRENPRVRILGSIVDLTPARRRSIDRRRTTALSGWRPHRHRRRSARVRTSDIGDGPHGGAGTGSGDFDFFKVTSRRGPERSPSDTPAARLDTVVAIYRRRRRAARRQRRRLRRAELLRQPADLPGAGQRRLLRAGRGLLPLAAGGPVRLRQRRRRADEGDYAVSITSAEFDADYYAVRLDKGDVIGAVGKGVGRHLTIWRPDGTQMVGLRSMDASSLYAPASPLPGGGNTTLAYVAERVRDYASRSDGRRGATTPWSRPTGPARRSTRAARVQTVFLDFDGARVNTGIWGGPGVRDLSPFGSFVAKWGLTRPQEATLINRITATVRENIRRDLIKQGSQ